MRIGSTLYKQERNNGSVCIVTCAFFYSITLVVSHYLFIGPGILVIPSGNNLQFLHKFSASTPRGVTLSSAPSGAIV